MCAGGFNEIAVEGEKQGGRSKQPRKMDAFNEMMRDTRLADIGYKGSQFTWCNSREGTNQIQERLDRAIVNLDWIRTYPYVMVIQKLQIGSDHCPLVIQVERQQPISRKPFRFEKG